MQAIKESDCDFKIMKLQNTGKNFMLVKAGNVEDAIKMLNSLDYEIRRAEIKKKTTMLDIATEYARIEEKQVGKSARL